MGKDQKLYEITYLISPAYSEEEAQAFQQSLKNEIKSLGGLIDNEGGVLKRRLSYPIKKMLEAYLASFRFLLASEKIREFETKLIVPQVLRYLAVHTKRQSPHVARAPRIGKIIPERPALKYNAKNAPQAPEIKQPVLESAANIEEIDKKLEEILGK
ncbi:MAG: 30S ribosomal protein S6 [Candidatus Giovannonibacteria bacterium GW2011_GWC2_44_9]|uniref:Small ribosomal subunit protein bS6 n=3 Tax=Candidatus Giovannoniibacteriota TaxID=1752738 RepID=A0A0G1IYY4_9BACT|nr:MAG: 30S ribosomal protein S6 [Candidatus Giovannonibacteria bacterium GW2011_GWB1_44_23]KKT64203.1 MAG: 30S ribosomal protein S6 [Candidatus Giovannonibacteria bacterium GW2011_GWA1_44_29]KKT84440.1 MAG: 30S ribosomal protein S6 [Candidatus Giovannonibacteria bacterium GW2011_GWC2_44_9]KKT91804.1 MAG: 30S ribosomal protein S6 [Parcubacteria group bacterium GW2011_GWC1_45_13]